MTQLAIIMATPSPFDDVQFPPLLSLPFRTGDPPGAIWGFYESLSDSESKASKPDELGALNLLTPTRILKASREEIQLGKVVSLNWPLQKPQPAGYHRRSMEHKVFKWPGKYVVDDEIVMKCVAVCIFVQRSSVNVLL
jgi:hypothetical protein